MTPLQAAQEVIESIGLDPWTTDFHVCFGTDYTTPDYEKYARIEFNLEHGKLNPAQRRNIKKLCKLEVPQWALDSTYKPLEGNCHYSPAEPDIALRIDLHFSVSGAFKCEVVGEEEVEPDERKQKEAAALAAMTPEDALEHVRKLAENLRKPTTKARYRCEPVR